MANDHSLGDTKFELMQNFMKLQGNQVMVGEDQLYPRCLFSCSSMKYLLQEAKSLALTVYSCMGEALHIMSQT